MDSCGDVLVAGSTKGAFTGSNLGLDDIFAVKLDILTGWRWIHGLRLCSLPGSILWSFQTGTTSEDLALGGVRLDVSGSLIIAGQTTGDLSGANAGGWATWPVGGGASAAGYGGDKAVGSRSSAVDLPDRH